MSTMHSVSRGLLALSAVLLWSLPGIGSAAPPANGELNAYRQAIQKNQTAANTRLTPTTATTLATTTATAAAVNGFINGGFEDGGFNGWAVMENMPGLTPWIVCNTGQVCGFFGNSLTQPPEGLHDAANGFDGPAGYQATLFQDILVPMTDNGVLFYDRIQFDGLGIPSSLPRVYEVQVRSLTGAVLEVLHHQEVLLNGKGYTDLGWVKHQFSLAKYAGQMIRLQIELTVPENFTGPANVEFDGFTLQPVPDVRGCVESRGAPVAGREVLLYQQGAAEKRTITDAAGCYQFDDLLPGNNYDVIIRNWMP